MLVLVFSFLEIHKEFVKDLLGRRRNWQDSLRGIILVLQFITGYFCSDLILRLSKGS